MTSITVQASRWSGGWELAIDDAHHTSVRDLRNARQQVIDYLDTVDETVDHATWDVTIVPEIGALGSAVEQARAATKRAQAERDRAAAQSREVAGQLRSAGYSVSDTAAIMGVSRGRISQLTRAVGTIPTQTADTVRAL